jgi:hypothetical protein
MCKNVGQLADPSVKRPAPALTVKITAFDTTYDILKA